MFREIRRIKQKISLEKCIDILENQPRGVLSIIGTEGYPYGMPMNHWYCKEGNKIYFHTAKSGHKLDAFKESNKVSFCVYDEGYRKEGEWSLNINSVIVFGTIKLVEDDALSEKICRNLALKFTDDTEYIDKEIKNSLKHVQCLEIIIDHISGKLVNES